MTALADPVRLGRATARNRLVFGPHETNLGHRRALSSRHVAYYLARAAGGAGTIVTEEASVHDSDWPYERAPLATECGPGWREIVTACRPHGTLVVAALGHSGGQGSSAYHQRALWGPSRCPDVATREVPAPMEPEEIGVLIDAFAGAARAAMAAGCDGVEVNAGQWSLLRQYWSGLTNQRADGYGSDKGRLLGEVLAAVREAVPNAMVGLRASCDELAPWAGIVPAAAIEHLVDLVPAYDYVAVVRGSAYGTGATRPDGHVETGFNRDLVASVRSALPEAITVIAQGSIVDIGDAEEILVAGDADAVEMTRAQIADPELGRKVASGRAGDVRPCVLCNQLCQVRDVRNPLVTCIGEPRSGHEWEDAPAPSATAPRSTRSTGRAGTSADLIVVGGGPAGLECARVAAAGGLAVTLLEREASLGGMVSRAAARAPGRQRLGLLVAWLEAQCRASGVELRTGHEAGLEELDTHAGAIVCATGSRPGRRGYDVSAPTSVVSAADLLAAERRPGDPGPPTTVVWDPIGGPIGVGTAELLAGLGASVHFVTPDLVAGEHLARTGDLAPANVRLQQVGVAFVRASIVRAVEQGGVVVEHRYSGERTTIPDALLVDAGHRLPEDTLYRSLAGESGTADRVLVVGDAVAPRTVHEAVLEGRRAALGILGIRATVAHDEDAHVTIGAA